MRSIRVLLSDRKRSQRGSVLSAVLIITAFLAIISGALMTTLSTNFLLADRLVSRVATEATVNSAAELAIGRLQDTQTTPLYDGCPSLGSASLNNLTAASSYTKCTPVIDARSPQGFTQVASAKAFGVDGTHVVLGARGVDEYLTADGGGTLFAAQTGQSSPRWSVALGGETTATPLAMPDASSSSDLAYLLPVTRPTNTGVNPSCGAAEDCVAFLNATGAGTPSLVCYMAASDKVMSMPAGGANYPGIAYFGDNSGNLYAYDSTEGGQCSQASTSAQAAGDAVVAGPYVFAGPTGKTAVDEIFVVVSTGSTGALLRFTYSGGTAGPGLQLAGSLFLGAVPVGAAVDGSALPARLAISFTTGTIAMAQISSSFGMSLAGTASLPAGSADSPYWCHCPGGVNLIGFGATNGGLYVVDTNLNLYASYKGAAPIVSTPEADAGGDWFIAASDGTLTEVQRPFGGGGMIGVVQYGSSGAITSAPDVVPCAAGICIYFGSTDSPATGRMFLVLLDARDAVFNSCITSSPPACVQGVNPRLWTQVEVGVAGSPQTVHVKGWSYYSP